MNLFNWARTQVAKDKVDVIEITERREFGYITDIVKASDIGLALVDRITELSQNLSDANKTIFKQERMIIALKSELGQIALKAEGEKAE